MNINLEKEDKNVEKRFSSVFTTTFTAIFIAELGDKTQIATLMLSAESGKPVIVFLGSSIALISSSLVGVLIGKWLSNKISPNKFAFFTGLLMILISLFLGYDIIRPFI
ncbi:conserved hypothetical protein [Prochlorococcus marinus str. MIT 9515]|uniref:GDT1 family protein n=1 Tax=Prochlorococcus marinus (strain MIT 9515) TaxID=167542 RepID=A2BWH1_PROM5|nr:TMEM165/GDT1 family protein [Prochlorococcus marinus]ABM72132.1 conserved hypothetical protein [Prochlorococcus marinus str. MIT 9515]